MLEYAVLEIAGKQYKVSPNKPIEVDWLGDIKEIEANVLILAENGNLKIGNPYLKEKIKLTSQGLIKKKKVRVAKFHAKVNYRRVLGSRRKMTKLVLFS